MNFEELVESGKLVKQRRIEIDGEKLNLEDIVNAHNFIVAEMKRRGMKHATPLPPEKKMEKAVQSNEGQAALDDIDELSKWEAASVEARRDLRVWASPQGCSKFAARIIEEMPDHRIYVEPFVGGASIFLYKTPSEVDALVLECAAKDLWQEYRSVLWDSIPRANLAHVAPLEEDDFEDLGF